MTQNILPELGPVASVFQCDRDTRESFRVLLEMPQTELEEDRSELGASRGEYRYRSVAARAVRESHYDRSGRMREEAIKRLADRRIESMPRCG